jgi:hypothetical protein
MKAAAVPGTRAPHPATVTFDDVFPLSRAAITTIVLVAVLASGLGLRAAGLSAYGFSTDEINKVDAIAEYRRGHFGANAEHPMLMKLAMWASVEAADAWNRIAPEVRSIDIESAVRLPNAVLGAATALLVFGVCEMLFGTSVGLMASALWALDVNAIAINRIGKEDTFALFFFLLAVFCYERGKRVGRTDPLGARPWYTGSGTAFGLMLASKYFPQYLGAYALFNVIADPSPGDNKPDKRRYYGAMLGGFVLANAGVLSPATWEYCLRYVQGATVVHHGYSFAGRLYSNSSALSAGGIPATFYAHMLATKVPLVVLAAMVAGLIETIRRRRERGFLLLQLWGGPFFVGYSLVAAKFLRYALPLFAVSDILAAVGVVAGVRWVLRKGRLLPQTRVAVAAAALTLAVAGPFAASSGAGPFYSFFRNAIGERTGQPLETFPEETYDYGVREAVGQIAADAEPGAAIVSDAPAVVAYYAGRRGRPDLRARSLSAGGVASGAQPTFVLVQAEHVTFENRDAVGRLRRTATPWREIHAGGAVAVQVYRLPRS